MTGAMRTELIDDAAWVTISDPPKGVLNPALMREVVRDLRSADENPEVRAIVITGPEGSFCAGLDIEALQAGADPVEFARELVTLLKLVPTLGKPVLAAVNGDALASGFSLMLTADYVVAVDGLKLGTFESSVGVWPMIAQVPVLQRLLPRHALSNILSGEPFTTTQALAVGAINEIVAPEDLVDVVRAHVPRLIRADSALAAGRRAFYRFLDLGYADALDQSLDEFVSMLTSKQ